MSLLGLFSRENYKFAVHDGGSASGAKHYGRGKFAQKERKKKMLCYEGNFMHRPPLTAFFDVCSYGGYTASLLRFCDQMDIHFTNMHLDRNTYLPISLDIYIYRMDR